jgi:hypothetical protein
VSSNNNNENNDNGKYKGREKSGHAVVSKGTSAASVAKLLKGIDFPADKDDLLKQIRQNKWKVEDNDNIDTVIDIINQMADKQYSSMTDVEHKVGQVK